MTRFVVGTKRGTGKTRRMVRALPKHRSLVLVHCGSMKLYVEHMVRDLRPELQLNRDVYVRVIEHECDIDWLRGLHDREVRVDHAVWERLHPRIADPLRVQLRLMTRPMQPRPGLGVVNTTIEYNENGDIAAVVLPGHGWE